MSGRRARDGRRQDPGPDSLNAVWIKSEPDEHGRYHLYLELGPDDVTPLDVTAAYGWAREVLSAAAAAEYDAAVLAQLAAIGLDDGHAVTIVTALREDRAPYVPVGAVPGLALIPGVSHRNRLGFLRLERHGQPVGQWELGDAREHALAVIEALEVTVMDSAYLRALTGIVGVDRTRALAVVTDLASHRPARDGAR